MFRYMKGMGIRCVYLVFDNCDQKPQCTNRRIVRTHGFMASFTQGLIHLAPSVICVLFLITTPESNTQGHDPHLFIWVQVQIAGAPRSPGARMSPLTLWWMTGWPGGRRGGRPKTADGRCQTLTVMTHTKSTSLWTLELLLWVFVGFHQTEINMFINRAESVIEKDSKKILVRPAKNTAAAAVAAVCLMSVSLT